MIRYRADSSIDDGAEAEMVDDDVIGVVTCAVAGCVCAAVDWESVGDVLVIASVVVMGAVDLTAVLDSAVVGAGVVVAAVVVVAVVKLMVVVVCAVVGVAVVTKDAVDVKGLMVVVDAAVAMLACTARRVTLSPNKDGPYGLSSTFFGLNVNTSSVSPTATSTTTVLTRGT